MKISLFISVIAMLFSISLSLGQVNYSTSFDGCNSASCGDWSIVGGTSGNITSSTSLGYTPCNTSSAKSNIWSVNPTTTLTSVQLGISNGTPITFSFNGKAIEYSTGSASAAGACTFQGFWSTDGSSWNALNTLNNISSTSCNTYTFVPFTPTCNSPVYLRIVATRVSSDFWAVIDDINVSQAIVGPTGSITKTCAPDYSSYDLEVVVSTLDGATGVDIAVGATTYYSNVGLGTYTISGLNVSDDVNVSDVSDPCRRFSESVTACSICNDAPALPTDECASAPLIDLSQPFIGSTACSYTVSAGSPSGCGVINNDSWMRFIAGSSEVDIEFTIGDCNPIDDGIQLAVFSGTCGSLSLIPGTCLNPSGENTTGTWNFSGLTIGNIYYIRIDGYAGDLCDYFFEPLSGVVLTPDNDVCANRTTLNCGDSNIASNILATDTDAPSACTGGGSNPTGNGVWYSFIGNGEIINISTDSPNTNFDTRISVYTGTCGALVCQGGDISSGSGTTSDLTFPTLNGTEYFVYVSGNGASQGQFEISLNCCATSPGLCSSLPIELLTFTAERQFNDVAVNWTTATEINNDFFSIERSPNGNDWEVIGTIKGAGNSIHETDYVFIDKNPLTGTSYYRLKQTDFNGDYSYSAVESVHFSDYAVRVFPNPAKHYFQVRSDRPIQKCVLLSVLNQTVSVFSNSDILDVSDLPRGSYLLRVFFSEYESQVVKVVIAD